ncbi:MAG: acetolactate synthase small subunit [Muribaculaceae bacterium]|nr:acetolactate synthase small subunit [Muribaculaceae bacterium]MDY5827432.1 acetolactate synthase small subunit [Candidatus Limisoma sp.]
MDNTLYTVAVFSENRVGLLNQISIIFTRRKLNIESLSVSPSSIKGVHKFTITAYSDEETIEKLVKQIEKRIDVLKAFYYTDNEIVYQEIALYKVPTKNLIEEQNLEKIIRRHNARILEISAEYTAIEKTGHNEETEALFEELKRYGITQFVRSGRVAITKSNKEFVTEYIEEQEQRKNRIDESN